MASMLQYWRYSSTPLMQNAGEANHRAALPCERFGIQQIRHIFPFASYRQPSMLTPHSSPLHPASHVVDYPARDMTITVGAGLSIGELQRILREENQQLPIDVADAAMTLGRIVADDVCGPRQFGYGTLRDYVIGIEAVDGRGRVFHAGGRVVKNVAGYDLCRLLVGSRGQLGTITQITFKLKPLPPKQTLLVAGFRSLRDLESALDRLNVSATCPVILDVVGRSARDALLNDLVPDLAGMPNHSDAVALLVIGFEGPTTACKWQSKTMQEELHGTAAWVHEAVGPDATNRYCEHAQRASLPSPATAWMARITTLPSRVVAAVQTVQYAGYDVFGRAGNGVLFVSPCADSAGSTIPANEQQGMSLLQSLVSDGVGSVDVLQSVAARSTQSAPEVARISHKLRELLGA